MIKNIFPKERLSRADYVLGLTFVIVCFVFFFHFDMWGVGWDSLNYLFGDPLEFYENCKKFHGRGQNMLGTPYPPSIYIIFALWLYPLKLLGVITGPEAFSPNLFYWLKTLTTLCYAASGLVFYRIALEYIADRRWAKYATAIWLTTPIALFSQLIYSQYDIFYVVLTLLGFLLFLRGSPYRASICFGLAITFKYFPAFSYLPLLLLYEKRVPKIAFCILLFIAPLLLIELPYVNSPAFIEGVRNHFAVNKVFASAISIGDGVQIYLLFAAFALLCGLSYFTDPSAESRARTAAYVWLAGSILPFLFIWWHPYWMISFSPAIVLTSMISAKQKRFLFLDLVGMVFFIASVSLSWPHVVDASLLKASWIGIDFGNSFPMSNLFDRFGSHSLNMFLSGFWGYIALQIILKNGLLREESVALGLQQIDYGEARQRLYVGLLIFLVPAALSIYVDLKRHETFTLNFVQSKDFGELTSGRRFEQTFVADGKAITRVSLLFMTYGRPSTFSVLGQPNRADVVVEIIDPTGRVLAKDVKSTAEFRNLDWQDFLVDAVPVLPKALYKIRLTAPLAKPGNNAISWAASGYDSYPRGTAIVDGTPENSDFAFRVGFAK